MVQMKGAAAFRLKPSAFYFISHMVQMKVNICIDFPVINNSLYIPHGSDERKILNMYLMQRFRLYIPHGSDERATKTVEFGATDRTLYPTWFR